MTSSSKTNTTHKSKYYTIGITGSSGLIGTAFQQELAKAETRIDDKPVRVVTFTRQTEAEMIEDNATFFHDDTFTSKQSLGWNPTIRTGDDALHIDPSVFTQMDAMVHLSGENISTGQGLLAPLGIRPWTESKKQEIIESRVKTTTALAKAIKASGNTHCDLLVASGIGVYGPHYIADGNDNGPTAADETTDISATPGFLSEVSRVWEDASKTLTGGNRVCQLRNGVVLSTKGGALGKLYPIFFLGGGGIVGNGQQYFPYISLRDITRAMVHVLQTPSLTGPINMNGPNPATNAEFTTAMGTVMGRPTLVPFPAFAVSLLFGEMGEEILLGGTKAVPTKLVQSGFTFLDPTVEDAVRSAIED